jgi:hypothetical protein
MDGVEKELKKQCIVNGRENAHERDGWRKFLVQAKTHKKL